MRPGITILLVLSVLLVHVAGFAQGVQTPDKGRIQGKVVDAKSGEGLPGANVTVKGTYYGG